LTANLFALMMVKFSSWPPSIRWFWLPGNIPYA
jgi:hypothetical protein